MEPAADAVGAVEAVGAAAVPVVATVTVPSQGTAPSVPPGPPAQPGPPSRPARPGWAQILQGYRRRGGLSQRQVADLLGVPRSTYARMETRPATARLSPQTVEMIATVGALLHIPARPLAAALADARRQCTPPTPAAPRPARAGSPRPAWSAYLVDLRLRYGFTVSAAARAMGVAPQTWVGWETGTRPRNGCRTTVVPQEETLLRIGAALGVTGTEVVQLCDLAAASSPDAAPGRWRWQRQLRSARLARRMTAAEAARCAGVTVHTYRQWEHRPRGGPRHDCLRRLLPYLGITGPAVEAFMADVPRDRAAVRPPRQPSAPITRLPRWSQMLVEKRLAAGLPLAQVDRILGQQSIYRRFELGGWRRADGRLSVPSSRWLDRVAAALDMDGAERAALHRAADERRVALAVNSSRPAGAELLVEARRAAGLSRAAAASRVGPLAYPYAAYETGHPAAMRSLTDPEVRQRFVDRLPVSGLLAGALDLTCGEPDRSGGGVVGEGDGR